MPDPSSATPAESDVEAARLRSLWVLSLGQVLGGIGFGASLALGALIVDDVTGSPGLSGLATASITLGAAALAIPMARLARRVGRRTTLATGMLVALAGVLLVFAGTAARSLPILLIAFVLIGAGQAANLQSRFAATDLASDRTRGRDLSLVVWATTVGAVVGPLLVGPGDVVGAALALPPRTGPYVFTVAAQLAAVALYLVFLRPDPLLLANRLRRERPVLADAVAHRDRPRLALFAIVAVSGAHGVMVAVMAMTPVHLVGLDHAGHTGHAALAASPVIVGVAMSAHIAGMYALSPLFGWMADRIGRVPTIVTGMAVLLLSLGVAAAGDDSAVAVTIALVLLGVGWSASTVAGAALLTEASAPERRTVRQGRSDALMNLVGAGGAVGAGVVLGLVGYSGLALIAMAIVLVVLVWLPFSWDRRRTAATS